jgi:hypothetical protein
VAVLLGYVPLLFPDGHLLSRRWRPVAWLIGLALAGSVAAIAVQPNVGGAGSMVPYPFEPPLDAAVVDVVYWAASLGMAVGFALAIASLWLRWRRSSGVEREQLKWLAWAGGLVLLAIPISLLPLRLAQALFIFAVATVPLAVGIAILRYRLYDIDAVISRTLVFGALTAILAGLFAGLQRLFQTVFVSATGNESDAALVITTLVLATLFAPLKRSLEKIVESRFREPATVDSGATTPEQSPGQAVPATADSDLEAILRRVVRDEIRAALATKAESGPDLS